MTIAQIYHTPRATGQHEIVRGQPVLTDDGLLFGFVTDFDESRVTVCLFQPGELQEHEQPVTDKLELNGWAKLLAASIGNNQDLRMYWAKQLLVLQQLQAATKQS
jgi:hypothetical protein